MIFSVLNKIIFSLNILAAVALGVSYAAPYVNPNVFWPVAFFGLAYPVLVVANIIFVFYWLLRAKLWVVLSLAPLIFGYNHIFKYVQFNSQQRLKENSTVKVMSMNVGFFRNASRDGNGKLEMDRSFLEYISRENPDILILQEFTPLYLFDGIKAPSAISNALTFKTFFKYRNSFQEQVIFTRYPVIKSGTIDFAGEASPNGAMWVDVKKDKDTIRVYNIHFQSFGLNKKFSMDSIDSKERAVFESRNIINRIRIGNAKRAEQVKLLKAEFAKCKHKIILAGDFNDTPMSFTYHEFSKQFRDAFMDAAWGFGSTYVGPYPSYRIDYIMSTPDVQARSFTRGPNFVSDHRAIIAEMEVD